MRKYFLTLDLEEWYHLEYVKDYMDVIGSKQKFVPHVIPFLEKMADEDIYMTVFALEDVARENPIIVKKIVDMGHEIACHGSEHELVYKLSTDEFREKTKRAKQVLEETTGETVIGYRAPCFSMDNEKLDVLWDLGFKYDASLIRFKEHKIYNVLDMTSFTKIESMIYQEGNNFEFETPTLDILGISIPISGGGYFRLFPLRLMKHFMKQHWKEEENFVFYIHPFELTGESLENAKAMGIKNYFRFEVGRATLRKKLFKYLKWLKEYDVTFMRFRDYVEHKQ